VNLFPFVSITTGELKPRRIFVDEHAYHISAISSNNARIAELTEALAMTERKDDTITAPRSFRNYCSEKYHACFVQCYDAVTSGERCVAVETYRSSVRSSSGEAIAIVVPWYSNEVSDASVRARLARAVGTHVALSDCIAKDVVFVHVQVFCGADRDVCTNSSRGVDTVRHSHALARWLRDITTYSPNSSTSGSTSTSGSVPFLRDVYIIDFGTSGDSESELLGTKGGNRKGKLVGWDGVAASYIGYNGLLPNMDMLGVAKAMLPELEFTGTFDRFSLLASRGAPLVGLHPSRSLPIPRPQPLPHNPIAAELGLHSQLLEINVDALTLSPFDSGDRAQRAAPLVPETLLFAAVAGLVRASSNLYEELHHSNHYYLVLDAFHFVGLPEFSPSLLLLMVALGLQCLARCGATATGRGASETVIHTASEAEAAADLGSMHEKNDLLTVEKRRAFVKAVVIFAEDCGGAAVLGGTHLWLTAMRGHSSAWGAAALSFTSFQNDNDTLLAVLTVLVLPNVARGIHAIAMLRAPTAALTATESSAAGISRRFHKATCINSYFSLSCTAALAVFAVVGLQDYVLCYSVCIPTTLLLVVVMELTIPSATVVALRRVHCTGTGTADNSITDSDGDSVAGAYQDLLERKTMLSRILRYIRGLRSAPAVGVGATAEPGEAPKAAAETDIAGQDDQWFSSRRVLISIAYLLTLTVVVLLSVAAVSTAVGVGAEYGWIQSIHAYLQLWLSVSVSVCVVVYYI